MFDVVVLAELGTFPLWLAFVGLAVLLVFAPTVMMLATRYRRCPSNRVFSASRRCSAS